MKKSKTVLEIHCDYDGKIIPRDHKTISIGDLDFCSIECIEKYIKENENIECPICRGDENIKCEYCGNFKTIVRSISDILKYGKKKMECQKCNGEGNLNNKEDDPLFDQIVQLNTIYHGRIANKICDICYGAGTIKIPNKRV